MHFKHNSENSMTQPYDEILTLPRTILTFHNVEGKIHNPIALYMVPGDEALVRHFRSIKVNTVEDFVLWYLCVYPTYDTDLLHRHSTQTLQIFQRITTL